MNNDNVEQIKNDENPLVNNNTDLIEHTTNVYDDESTDYESEKPYKVKAIRAVSRVSACLQETWYCFEFSETREIVDDTKIAEIRNDLWNTVNNEVDNQVQYTIDSILGKVQSTDQSSMPINTNNSVPPEYDY